MGTIARLGVLVLAAVVVLTGCDVSGEDAAGRIDDQLRPLPGVWSVSHNVRKELGMTAAGLWTRVEVHPEATAEQLTEISRTYEDVVHNSAKFGKLPASLSVSRRPRERDSGNSWSEMTFDLKPGQQTPSPPWSQWLRLSDGDYGNEIRGSAWPPDEWTPAGHRQLTINVLKYDDPHADSATAQELAPLLHRLAADFPETDIDWKVRPSGPLENGSLGVDSDHGLPSPPQVSLWEAISVLSPVRAEFKMNSQGIDRNQFTLQRLPAAADVDRVVSGQLQLIKDSRLPALYKVESAGIQVRPGSCSAGIPDPPPYLPENAALQTRLRAQFESCPR